MKYYKLLQNTTIYHEMSQNIKNYQPRLISTNLGEHTNFRIVRSLSWLNFVLTHEK